MPFKDDRRTPSFAQFIATAVCGVVIGAFVLAVSREQRPSLPPSPPAELKVPVIPRRAPPAVPASAVPKPVADASGSASQPKKPQPEIRVNLTTTPQTTLRLAVRGPYVIRSLDAKQMLLEGNAFEDADIGLNEKGWWFGSKKPIARQPVEIAAKSTGLVTINRHSYHGVVRLYPQPSGKIMAVNVLPLEEYVSCVIDAEMPAKFPAAAREAQAIVARTYALWQIQQADPAANYDVFATVRSQKYLGVEYTDNRGRRLAGESASSKQAAAATRGLVSTTNGKIFCTYYSAVCGGATTPGRQIFSDADAVLRSVPCEWCRESDKYRWKAELTTDALLAAARRERECRALTGLKAIRQTAGPQAGVISQFMLSDGRKEASISGMSLRENLPAGKLLSPHFSLRLSGERVFVEGAGFGHGAGLCQWGARGLAESGRSSREIVQHYYPGASVTAWGY